MQSLHIKQRITKVFQYRFTNITMLKQHEHPYMATKIKQNQEHIWRLQKKIDQLQRLECRIQSLTDKQKDITTTTQKRIHALDEAHKKLDTKLDKVIAISQEFLPLIKHNHANSTDNIDAIDVMIKRIEELESICDVISVFFPFHGLLKSDRKNPISSFSV